MASANYDCTSFLGGEWSNIAQGRIEKPEYKTAMNVCLNGLPTEQGAWTRRPGFALGGETLQGRVARVMNYEIQQNNPYTLEFTTGNLRFWSGQNISRTNDKQAVLSVSTATPAIVTTTTAHGWPVNSFLMFDTLGTADPQLIGRQFYMDVVPGHTDRLALYDMKTSTAVDGSLFKTFTTGNIARLQILATPYLGTTWDTVQLVQEDTNGILLHSTVMPQVLVPTQVTGGYTQFALEPANFQDGPYLDFVTGGAQVVPSGVSGIISLTLAFASWSASIAYSKGDYVVSGGVSYQSTADYNLNHAPSDISSFWTVVSPAHSIGPNGFTQTDIGRHVRLNSEPALWNPGTTYAVGQTVTYGNQTYWTCLAVNTNVPPNTDIVRWGVATNAANWAWGKITSLSNTISGTVSGVAHIGDMTRNGGLASAFNGAVDQASAVSASQQSTQPAGFNQVLTSYIGQDYSGGSPTGYAMASVTMFPTTDGGLIQAVMTPGIGQTTVDGTWASNVILYASNSLPANANDGIVMATQTIYNGPAHANGNFTFVQGVAPITLTPSDTTTVYKYWWLTINNTMVSTNAIAVFTNIAQVQFVSSATGTSAGGVNVAIIGSSLINTTTIRTWRLGAYSNTTGWPTCGTFHEGRLALSGVIKNRFDMSRPNQEWGHAISFAPTEGDGSVTDSNGITYTFNSTSTNAILWMKSQSQGVLMGTEKGEWLVQATTANAAITPLNCKANEVTQAGSSVAATALPTFTEHTIIFIQRYARKVMEYFADVFSGKFTVPNLMENATHLSKTDDPLVELVYQQNISPVIWARTALGNLLGCTYKRDSLMSSQGPTAKGWHHHDLGSGRQIASIAVGPSPDGTLDSLAAVTIPTATGGAHHVCFLTRLFEETNDAVDAAFMDEAISPTTYEVVTLSGVPNLHIMGLWPLNGKTVDVFAGGIRLGQYAVANGETYVPILPQTVGTIFTTTFIASFNGSMPIRVGFYYTSQGQLVRPASPQDTGARLGPAIGKIRRNHKFAAQLVATQDISFGCNFIDLVGGSTTMHKATLKSKGGSQVLPANQLFSGIYRDNLADDYSLDGMICWQCSGPYPATIAAIGGFIETQDM